MQLAVGARQTRDLAVSFGPTQTGDFETVLDRRSWGSSHNLGIETAELAMQPISSNRIRSQSGLLLLLRHLQLEGALAPLVAAAAHLP